MDAQPTPPPLGPFNILQWNAQGLRTSLEGLLTSLQEDNVHVAVLQETMLPEGRTMSFRRYDMYTSPYVRGGGQGTAILVKKDVFHRHITSPIDCGEGVEVLAVEVTFPTTTLTIYGIYRRPNEEVELDLGELFEFASHSPTLVAGDFNGHHPLFAASPTATKRNTCGDHIVYSLQEFPDVTLINNPEPTHEQGGVLDLTFVSKFLAPRALWSIHPTLASDHFATTTTINMPQIPSLTPPPHFKFKAANWSAFQGHLLAWLEAFVPPPDVQDHEQCVADAFLEAARASIPLASQACFTHRNHWFYGPRVREIKHRVQQARKNLQKHPSPGSMALFREVVRNTKLELREIRNQAWLEWCQNINAHTTVKEMWTFLNIARGQRRPTLQRHPDPGARAEELMASFADRCATNQLPAGIRRVQEGLRQPRTTTIEEACAVPAASDAPFSLAELKASIKTGRDTATGEDCITYSMIHHGGDAGLSALCTLLNHSWDEGVLPANWKKATIVPIPKRGSPGQMRPISLLSCLGKTCERAVLQRLLHVLGPPHPRTFAYTRKTGTTENIASIIGLTDNTPAIVVFLDLEKAFELANAEAILFSLARKGVCGKLLRFLRDFLDGRQACTKFQGRTSSVRMLENGTPQGSILSPTLFNTLIENLVSLPFRQGVTLLAYADDLQLIATGPNRRHNAQHALELIEKKCAELALKINPQKSKVVPFSARIPDYHLHIQEHRLEWAESHTCLGLPFSSRLPPRKVLTDLLTRTSARINVLRSLANTTGGAGYHVLRSFYVHGIRSLVDYAAPALLTLEDKLRPKLETIQNRAMRVCLGAPMWTRLENLRVETGLVPLQLRVQQMVVGFILKAFRAPRPFPFKERVLGRLDVHNHLIQPHIWAHAAVVALRVFRIPAARRVSQVERPHPQFAPTPPWEQLPATFTVTELPGPKRLCTAAQIRDVTSHLGGASDAETATYYTDGSVDRSTGRAGASVHCQEHTACWRVSNDASTLQTELLAIDQALRHAVHQPKPRVNILTDSLSSIQLLQKRDYHDHTLLLTTIFVHLQTLRSQEKSVHFTWIPSHCDIAGNERADEAAKTALSMPGVTLTISPSVAQVKAHVRRQAWTNTLIQHQGRIIRLSPSATWYRTVTEYEPVHIPKDMPRGTATAIHRLRLGYRCLWEIRERSESECKYCEELVELPLLHYLLQCPTLPPFRPPDLEDYPLHMQDSDEQGARAARILLEHPQIVATFPPPR